MDIGKSVKIAVVVKTVLHKKKVSQRMVSWVDSLSFLIGSVIQRGALFQKGIKGEAFVGVVELNSAVGGGEVSGNGEAC